VLQIHNRLMLV